MNRERHRPSRRGTTPLREDLHALGQLMGDVLREQGGEELAVIGRSGPVDRQFAGAAAMAGASEALAVRVRGRPPRQARELVRAFSAWFQLVNVAEKVHRIRRRREYFQQEGDRPQPGGVEDALVGAQSRGHEPRGRAGAAVRSCRSSRCCWRIRWNRPGAPRCCASSASPQLLLERDNATLAPTSAARCSSRIRTRDQHRLADRGASARAAHRRRRARARDLLSGRDSLSHRSGVLSGDRRSRSASYYGVVGRDARAAADRAFWHLGRRRHGGLADVHAKSIRETLARAQQRDHQQLSRRVPGARADAVAERQPRRHLARGDAADRGVPHAAAGRAGDHPSRHDRMPYRVLLAQIAERLQCDQRGPLQRLSSTARSSAPTSL